MNSKLIFITNKILSVVTLWFIGIASVSADYYAYVPDIASSQFSKDVYVVNTTLNILVDKVRLNDGPRDVIVSHNGKYVFVTIGNQDNTRYAVNVINTEINEVTANGLIPINGTEVRGMALTKDDNSLYVAYKDGIHLVERPGVLGSVTNTLELTYGAKKLILSDDEKYLFVIGTDSLGNDGISVVEVSSFTEIANHLLGANKGASELVFDVSNLRLFIALSTTDQVAAVDISNYQDPLSFSFESETVLYDLESNSNPIDLQLHKNNSELFVVLSFLKDETGKGEGSIIVLPTDDITAGSRLELTLSAEGGAGSSEQGVIHPVALNIDDNGQIHILKRVWNKEAGLYLSKLDDPTTLDGSRAIKGVHSLNLGNGASTPINGRFVGPDCSTCPTGVTTTLPVAERPAGLNALFLLFVSSLLLVIRRSFPR